MEQNRSVAVPPWLAYLDRVPLSEERIIPIRETRERAGVSSDMQLLRMERRGVFPPRCKVNATSAQHRNAAAGHSFRQVLAWIMWRLASASA